MTVCSLNKPSHGRRKRARLHAASLGPPSDANIACRDKLVNARGLLEGMRQSEGEAQVEGDSPQSEGDSPVRLRVLPVGG